MSRPLAAEWLGEAQPTRSRSPQQLSQSCPLARGAPRHWEPGAQDALTGEKNSEPSERQTVRDHRQLLGWAAGSEEAHRFSQLRG